MADVPNIAALRTAPVTYGSSCREAWPCDDRSSSSSALSRRRYFQRPKVLSTEEREQRLKQRRKQLALGKATREYKEYRQQVPLHERDPRLHPITPNAEANLSKRAWNRMTLHWRANLHQWDPPTGETTAADAPCPTTTSTTTDEEYKGPEPEARAQAQHALSTFSMLAALSTFPALSTRRRGSEPNLGSSSSNSSSECSSGSSCCSSSMFESGPDVYFDEASQEFDDMQRMVNALVT